MQEVTGNLWDYYKYNEYLIAITTNGFIKKDGTAVMGRGCAAEAAEKYDELPYRLGGKLHIFGNHVNFFSDIRIFTYPVKHKWFEEADLQLIQRSALEIRDLMNALPAPYKDMKVIIPRPGCGNGKLKWEKVKPYIEQILDDRFIIISKGE